MVDRVFDSLMIHTCTIIQGGVKTGSYGHRDVDWATPLFTYTDVPCRIQPLTAGEVEQMVKQNQIVPHTSINIAWRYIPEGMHDPRGSANFRIENVYRRDGTVQMAGPFDVKEIVDEAGENHHVRVMLVRQP